MINDNSSHTIIDIEEEKCEIDEYDQYNYYFKPDNSFYKLYDIDIYNQLISLKDDKEKIVSVLNHREFNSAQRYLIPFLRKIHLVDFDNDLNIEKIDKILEKTKIPNFVIEPQKKLLSNINIALLIEKYYRDCRKIILDDCPPYPPTFDKPVFDPCRYPHILSLYEHFFEYCHDQKQLNYIAGSYYSKLNKIFLIPGIFFSGIASILSFVAASCFLEEKSEKINIAVGTLAGFVAICQSLSSAYQFESKCSYYNKSADLYDELLTKIDFEKSYPSNVNFFRDLEKEIIKIKNNSPYLVPNSIKKKYRQDKEKIGYNQFIKRSVIEPGRKEIIEYINGNLGNNYSNQMNINQNIDFIKENIIKINNLEKELVNKSDDITN